MTVDELIEALQWLSDAGKGSSEVYNDYGSGVDRAEIAPGAFSNEVWLS